MAIYVRYVPALLSSSGSGGGGGGSGTVTSVSVSSANGFAGSVLTPTSTPAITLSTTITGILQGNGTAISAATTGNLTDVGTDGIVITGGTGAVLGAGASLAQHVSDATHNGYLSSTDWVAFNAKQAAGNYITALTGDATASGPGSAALTLATVNGNVGSFGSASAVGTFTVNAKGLVTAASSTSIQIAESQVTNLVSDLAAKVATASLGDLTDAGTDGIVVTGGTGAVVGAVSLAQHVSDSTHNGYLSSTDWSTFNGKQAAGNYITALTGDVTASGPGSAATTLATVNANVGSFGSASASAAFTVNAKGLITAASSSSIQIAESQVTGLVADLASKVATASLGDLTDVGTDGIVVTGGTGAIVGSVSLAQHVSDATHNGYLSSTDWSTFNGKQAAGSYITALTGDATAAGPGSSALTLATVNGNVGSFGSASSVSAITVNAKGLVTAAASTSIQIAESQVTNLVSDLAAKVATASLGDLTDAGTDGIVVTGGTGAVVGAVSLAQHVSDATHNGYLSSTDWSTFNGKQAAGSYLTALTGDVAASGPGSAAATIQANVVSNSKLAQMGAHTYKGNNTGSTANAADITSTQLTADLNLFTSGLQGLVPASGGGTTNFLRADGTFAAPTGTGTVTTVSVVSANGLAGTVANPTTAPAITLSTTITGILSGNGTAISAASTTGSGAVVLATSPTLVTPALGTPSALVLTNATGLPLTSGVTGALPIANGGTGQATKAAGFDALSPMTTSGDVIYGGASGTGTRLAKGNNGDVLTLAAGLPAWVAPGAGSYTAPTVQTFTTGSGTYTTPTSPAPLYLRVKMVGGGGGGSGSGTAAVGNGTAGGTTTFGSSLLTANGGGAGTGASTNAYTSTGGTATITTSATVKKALIVAGGAGAGYQQSASPVSAIGGYGGNSFLGGAGGGTSGVGNAATGIGAALNSGSGGGGASANSGSGNYAGAGGGAGGYLEAIISSPSATYSYAVAAGGTGGSAGTSGAGGGGGSEGLIIVEEYYQ